MEYKLKIPLQQHIGAPCKPVVSAGERVKKGQLIAAPEKLGANIHASLSGVVTAVTGEYIEIEPDKEQPEDYVPIKETSSMLEAIKEAGIVGMGGAGFPTHVKMDVDLQGGTVIANGVECEPLLSHNVRQMEQNPEIVYRGLKYAMQITNASRGYIAIKAKNKKAVEAMKSVIDDPRIEVREMPDIYPMGEERALVREILGQLLRPDQLPSAARAVISNVETLSRICEAVEKRKPVISKNVTVIGRLKSGRQARVFFDVPIGTPIAELIEKAGGFEGDFGEIIMGGPFTGKAVDLDCVVTKTTGGIIVTDPLPREKRKAGLLVCGCGANEARLREVAEKMGACVAGVERCKQVVDVKGGIKCENPGNCPGQAEKILKLKKMGADVLIVGTCSDCTNTVMGVAPKLKLPVYHHTDHVLRTVGHPLVRRLKK
ncbi:proline reductase-associated electron transfer protein PrdC [Thermosediminibacter oceani]|uniref:Respiratory-chain NADH dehydrogenase domain 51 kDa subunit n=1 Tax=Thermosediminibacter oceani (strain ATCC BAA-1034 / DSM 16646 / JW/IW-1228P) TaxID=555079 RepID=D9RYJ6_THEOJ|nr:proline reductase-associated electron transfer protein PrdC [Thermosediminibacter oceani]ADL08420.1 Respiratory-chain NADH dehydrogenase domain 51 kDa subunit [Thermosediminibacter oceani DSM 16646]